MASARGPGPPGYPLVSFSSAAKKDTASIPCANQNRGAVLVLRSLGLCPKLQGLGSLREAQTPATKNPQGFWFNFLFAAIMPCDQRKDTKKCGAGWHRHTCRGKSALRKEGLLPRPGPPKSSSGVLSLLPGKLKIVDRVFGSISSWQPVMFCDQRKDTKKCNEGC
jgi:hypothetical protein